MKIPNYTSENLFRFPHTPFTAYKDGNLDMRLRKKIKPQDEFKEIEKMKERGKISTLIDISDPNLWLCEVPDYFNVNLLPLQIANPFPNGMFIYIMDWNKDRENIVNPDTSCVEIYIVQNEVRMDFYRFSPGGTRDAPTGVGKLSLESSYYVNPNGKVKEKFLLDFHRKDVREGLRAVNAIFLGKLESFLEFLLTCRTLKTHLTSEDIPLEQEELQSRPFEYRGDIHKILYIKETPRILEAAKSLKSTGYLPKRYHKVRGHMCKSKVTGNVWFRKGHSRGNKDIGEVHKIYKMEKI